MANQLEWAPLVKVTFTRRETLTLILHISMKHTITSVWVFTGQVLTFTLSCKGLSSTALRAREFQRLLSLFYSTRDKILHHPWAALASI